MSSILKDMEKNKVMPSEVEFETDPCSCTSSEQYSSSNSTMAMKKSCIFKPFTCSCYEHLQSTKFSNNKILALIWALTSVLKYNPTDPLHYMSYQLLRWKYNNVPETHTKEVCDYINSQLSL